jgi:nitroreductase
MMNLKSEDKEMDAFEAIITRRSTRNYKPDAVEKDKLEIILNAGRYAPSGGNNQTNHFLIIQDKTVIAKLTSLAEAAFADMEITENLYSSLKNSITRAKKGGYVFTYNAPVLVVVANRKDYGNNMADCAVAIENMMIAANNLDLGSCWVNQLKWLNEDPDLLDYLRSLGLKENERVYGSVILGYPATDTGLPDRKPLERKGNEVTWI